jgi:hypothetical protein
MKARLDVLFDTIGGSERHKEVSVGGTNRPELVLQWQRNPPAIAGGLVGGDENLQ